MFIATKTLPIAVNSSIKTRIFSDRRPKAMLSNYLPSYLLTHYLVLKPSKPFPQRVHYLGKICFSIYVGVPLIIHHSHKGCGAIY